MNKSFVYRCEELYNHHNNNNNNNNMISLSDYYIKII